MTDAQLLTLPPPPYAITTDIISQTAYNIYLTDDIGAPSEYIDVFEVFRQAQQDDMIRLWISNGGGRLDTTIMFLDAMKETRAKVVGNLIGTAASAASIIFLACDEHTVANYSDLMTHNYSGGYTGKGQELTSNINFHDNNIRKLMEDVYTPFLSEGELERMFDGKDHYFGVDEINERLERLYKHRKSMTGEQEDVITINDNCYLTSSEEGFVLVFKWKDADYIIGFAEEDLAIHQDFFLYEIIGKLGIDYDPESGITLAECIETFCSDLLTQ